MGTLLRYIQQILSTPAIFVGLIAMLGLILKKADNQAIIKGTIKTILGIHRLGSGRGRRSDLVDLRARPLLALEVHIPDRAPCIIYGVSDHDYTQHCGLGRLATYIGRCDVTRLRDGIFPRSYATDNGENYRR